MLALKFRAWVLLEPISQVRPRFRVVRHPSPDEHVPVSHLNDPIDHSFHPLVEVLVFRDDLGEELVEPTLSQLLERLGGCLSLEHVLEKHKVRPKSVHIVAFQSKLDSFPELVCMVGVVVAPVHVGLGNLDSCSGLCAGIEYFGDELVRWEEKHLAILLKLDAQVFEFIWCSLLALRDLKLRIDVQAPDAVGESL